MKYFNRFFKRNAWLLIMLSVWGCSAQLMGMNAGAMADLQQEIASIAQETDWSEQIYQLNDLFDDDTNPQTLDSTTQTALADLISKVFTARLAQYRSAMGSNIPLSDLNLLLVNAQRSPMLSQEQHTTFSNYQRAFSVEQVVMQNQTEKAFDQQLNNVLSALGSAATATFDPLIQSFFFQQLTTLYKNRTTQSIPQQAKLNGAFSRAKTTPLIQESNKADVAAKSDILTVEATLRKAGAKETAYGAAIAMVIPLQTQDATKKFEEFTQNLNFTTISQFFNTRDNHTPEEITALINLLTQASTTSLLTPPQQEQIKTMLASLALEKSLIDALAKKDFAALLAALRDITTNNASAKPSVTAQQLYMNALQALFGLRPAGDLKAANDLVSFFTSALTSPLLLEANKATVQGWITTLQADITNLGIQNALKTALAKPDFIAKVSDINAIFTSNAGKTVNDDTKKQLFNGLKQLFDSRPKLDVNALTGLRDLLTTAASSTLLADADKSQLAPMQTQLDADLANARLAKELQDILAIPDYKTRMAALQKFMKDHAGQTLSPDIQKMLQDGLQDLINKRPLNDPSVLADLAAMLGSLGDSTLLSPDFKKQLTDTTLPAINADKDKALLSKQLQDILAIQDPKARLAALQKFMADNAGKTLPSDLQKMLQDGIQNLVNSRSNDPAFLADLANFVGGLGNSNLLSPDFKTQIANTLPAINADKDKALLNKQLQDILAIQDPKARLAALQKFMADNAGKTLPADIQKMLQDGIQNLVNSRSNDPAFLADLANFVGGLGNSGLLSPDFKTQMNNALAGINADKDKALMDKQLQDILAIQDPKARMAALQKFMADNAGKTLPADLQKKLQDGINGLINNRSALTDPAALGDLANFVGGLGNSGLLSPDFKNQMNGALTGINADKDKMTLGKTLQDILAIQDPKARLAALQKFMADNPGKTLPADLQKMLQDGINGLVNNRSAITDPATLGDLAKFVGGLNNNGMLSPDFKTQINNALPGLNADLDKATLGKTLQDTLALPDPKARLGGLQQFMTTNAGKTLSPDLQKNLQDGINGLVANRSAITDPDALGNLANFVGGLNNNNMLSPDFKNQINGMLPGINADKDKAVITKSLSDIAGLGDAKLQANALSNFVTVNKDKTLTPDQQQALQNSLQKAFDGRGALDPAALGSLANAARTAAQPGLVGANGLNTLNQQILPGLKKDTDNADLQAGMQRALAESDPNKKVDLVNQVLANTTGKDLTPATQAQLGQGLQSLIANKPTDPAALGKLASMLNQTKDSPVIDPASQQAIKAALPALSNPASLGANALSLGNNTANGAANQPAASSLPGATTLQNPAGLTGGIPGASNTTATPGGLSGQTASNATLPGLQNPNQLGLTNLPGAAAAGSLPGTASNKPASNATLPGLQNVNQLGISSLPGATPAGQAGLPGINQVGLPTAGQQSNLPGLQKAGQGGLTGLPGASSLPGQGQQNAGQIPGLTGLKPVTDLTMPGAGTKTGGTTTPTGANNLSSLPGLQTPAQLGNATGLPGAGTLGQKTASGLPGATQGQAGANTIPGLSGLKSVADLTMPGAGSAAGTAAGAQALSGLKAPSLLSGLPGNTAGTATASQQATAGTALGGGQLNPQAQGGKTFAGLKQVADVAMPGAQGGAKSQQLPGLQAPTMISALPGGTQAVATGVATQAASGIANQPGQAGQNTGVAAAGASDATEQALIQEIQQAMALPTLRERMLGLNNVLAKVGNRQFSPALQNAYAAAVQQLYDARHSEQTVQAAAESKAHKTAVRSKEKRKKIKTHKSHTGAKKGKKKKAKKNTKDTTHAEQPAAQATQPANASAPAAATSGDHKKKRRAKQ